MTTRRAFLAATSAAAVAPSIAPVEYVTLSLVARTVDGQRIEFGCKLPRNGTSFETMRRKLKEMQRAALNTAEHRGTTIDRGMVWAT